MASRPGHEHIVMIDGSSFLYRAFYAMRPLHTKEGVPVHAVYGFVRMFKKLIDTFTPCSLLVAWDSRGQTTRHALLPSYKAQRQAPPSDLFGQKELIQEFLTIVGVKQIVQTGVEADDLLYAAAQKMRTAVERVIIVTTDKDLAQMVDDTIVLYDAFKQIIIDRAGVEKQFGIPPERLPVYFALIGDASDNIPGVAGIGPKAAQPLAAQYRSIEDLYAHIDEITPERVRKKLIEQRDAALLSERLFLLSAVPLDITLEDCAFDAEQWSKAHDFFISLGFHSIIKGMQRPRHTMSFAERYGVQIQIVADKAQLQQMCERIRTIKKCAVDTEATSLRAVSAQLIGISLCCETGIAYYVPIAHASGENIASELLQELKGLFQDRSIAFVFHHAKYDLMILNQNGFPVWSYQADTLLAASLCAQPNERIGLKFLSHTLLHQEMQSYEELMASGPYHAIVQVPVAAVADYSGADAHQTWQLMPLIMNQLQETGQEELYRMIELPLIEVLLVMEREGIILDTVQLLQLSTVVESYIQRIQQQLYDLIGPEATQINFNAPRQVEKLLFETLQLTPLKKTTKGSYSTGQEVLEALAQQHPVPRLLLRYRELFKLKSTYIDALPEDINSKTGRIHTNFSQISTATGRLSSSDPNLQNIPVDRYEGISIRSAFKAPPGCSFISADYSQIELRVLAYLAQDKRLVNSFLHDEDIHAATASHLYGVPFAEVTHEQRQLGKRINFSILYGLTPYGLSRELHISMNDAKRYITTYFEQYPDVSVWMQKIIAETEEKGYVTTYFGRRRYLPAIHEKNRALHEVACRAAVNTVAQGTAAEIMKLGMLALYRSERLRAMDMRLVVQIHDELLISIPTTYAEEAAKLIQHMLEQVVSWNVPLRVTTRIGADWGAVSK